MVFKDRFQAAKLLARNLIDYKNNKDTVIVAIPKGGIPLAYTMSKELNLPFTLFFVKKISSPFNKEVPIGAVSENGFIYKNHDIISVLGVSSNYIENSAKLILTKMEEKKELYEVNPTELRGKRVILVDDGIATGTIPLLAAIALKKQKNISEIIIASPIASSDSLNLMSCITNKVEVLLTPKNFSSVGAYYQRFHQLSDKEILELLNKY